jgi:hypothetical protein
MIPAMLEEIYSQCLNLARVFNKMRIYLFLEHSATLGRARGVLTKDSASTGLKEKRHSH